MTDGSRGSSSDRADRDRGEVAEVDLAVVTMRFDAWDAAALHGVLAKYVVLTRMVPGCRNVDLCASATTPGRLLIMQKWDDAAAQREHFDSALMVEMAEACAGLLSAPPDIDLWDALSAHDLA
jgi:quinol monooxygenase YgiN